LISALYEVSFPLTPCAAWNCKANLPMRHNRTAKAGRGGVPPARIDAERRYYRQQKNWENKKAHNFPLNRKRRS
jgi:hypothetical protein